MRQIFNVQEDKRMDVIYNIIITNKDEILKGVIVTVVGGLIVLILPRIVSIIKKSILPKPLPEPEVSAIYLNKPQKSFEDNCWGRKKLLKKVLNEIVGGRKNLFTRKCIAVTGEEGIGKTLFCYTLFQDHLRGKPVYLGWIECNGEQSIFDIIKSTFKDPRFYRKNKDNILDAFNSLNKPCILFADQVDQNTPIDELEEISHCTNVILIVSGILKKINFADCSHKLKSLSEDIIHKIFEKHSDEDIDFMIDKNKKSVNLLLERYANGNPFLAVAFAKAKYYYNGRWHDVLENMEMLEYDDNDENYLKNILRQLYMINKLTNSEKDALSKLSIIQYKKFVEGIFNWLDIAEYDVRRLCNTYWMKQEDSVMYSIDEFHCKVIAKVLTLEANLENAIGSISHFLSAWGENKDNGFKWISPYIENILQEIQGYAPHIMDGELFSKFSYEVTCKYDNIDDKEKCLKWIELCHPRDTMLEFKKNCLEVAIKTYFIDTLFSFSEINQGYLEIMEKVKTTDSLKIKENYLLSEYCCFLTENKQYDDVVFFCKKYLKTHDMNLSDECDCDMLYRYLYVLNLLNEEESLKRLVKEEIIQDLYCNRNVSVTVGWSLGELGEIYAKWGNKQTSDICMRCMVVALNEERGFYHENIKNYLKVSDMEFAEYMHSCDELLKSLKDALDRKDAEALYIEGRYQEKYGNYDYAFTLYEEAAAKDSLRGMCSLALLYYRGQGETHDYDKARKYWEYCRERGHRGSYYWLGILLLDTDYGYPDRDYARDRELALQYLTKAAELGSERAKQKLSEF